MRIAYAGGFLLEGFRELGHAVLPLEPRADEPLSDQLAALGPEPDLVVLELFSGRPLPPGLGGCAAPLAVHCIDSVLNEFWLAPLAGVLDHVFVDQWASVRSLRRAGVRARWLPLCARRDELREPRPKEHLLTFVGRTTEHRAKRAHILARIEAHFPINVAEGVGRMRMQDLHAASHAVLNENMFPGLTLRVFQALASGSLLVTEGGGVGVDRLFTHGEHLLCYGPDTLLPLLEEVRAAPGRWAEVAAAGRAECEARHMSVHRAAALLEHVRDDPPLPRPDGDAAALGEASARLHHARRFGGDAGGVMGELRRLAEGAGPVAHEAARLLGGMYYRVGRRAEALPLLARGASAPGGAGLVGAMQAVTAELAAGGGPAGLPRVLEGMRALGLDPRPYAVPLKALPHSPHPEHDLFLLFVRILTAVGRVFDPGYHKHAPEPLPESAAEFARMAHAARPGPEALDAMLDTALRTGVESEVLPLLLRAVDQGRATREQTAAAAAICRQVYDPERAERLQALLRT